MGSDLSNARSRLAETGTDANALRERKSATTVQARQGANPFHRGSSSRLGRFFYQADSGLYRAVRDTFIAAFPSLQKDEFLEAFRDLGCYLVDLCGQPVDQLPQHARTSICHAGERRLARTIRELRPMLIVTVVRSIRDSVKRAEIQAGWSGTNIDLPYPGRWKLHRVEFQRQLTPLLHKTLPQH